MEWNQKYFDEEISTVGRYKSHEKVYMLSTISLSGAAFEIFVDPYIMIIINRFSVKPVETRYDVYGKVNRRLEHLLKLKTNTSKYESENIVVSYFEITVQYTLLLISCCRDYVQMKFISFPFSWEIMVLGVNMHHTWIARYFRKAIPELEVLSIPAIDLLLHPLF